MPKTLRPAASFSRTRQQLLQQEQQQIVPSSSSAAAVGAVGSLSSFTDPSNSNSGVQEDSYAFVPPSLPPPPPPLPLAGPGKLPGVNGSQGLPTRTDQSGTKPSLMPPGPAPVLKPVSPESNALSSLSQSKPGINAAGAIELTAIEAARSRLKTPRTDNSHACKLVFILDCHICS